MVEAGDIPQIIGVGRSAYQALNFIRGLKDSSVISAMFRWDGTRLEGNDKIVVELHKQDPDSVWYYSVEDVPDYIFVRVPVIESGIEELLGQIPEATNPTTQFWRWVQAARSGTIVGSGDPANVQVDFIIIGYRPKALLDHFTS